MLKNYIKIAWRNALSNRSYSIISLTSLVLGITLFFFIMIWAKREYNYDKSFPSAQQIYRIETNLQMPDGTKSSFSTVGWPVGKVLASEYPEIEEVTYMRDWNPIISFKGTHYYENALFGDSEFFRIFQYQLLEGNASTALNNPFSLVISKELKDKYFGNATSVIGKTLLINDTVPYQITGVFRDLSAPSHLKFDMIGSLATYESLNPEFTKEEYSSGWFDVNMYNYIKLKPSTSPQKLGAKIKNLVLEKASDLVAKTGFKSTLTLEPITKIYLYSNMATGKGTTGNIKTVRLFLLIGIFILIIACLNFINLTTAKSVERAKEIGIKKVLGSNRKKLVFQFLTETALLCLIATIISCMLMIILLPIFNSFSGEGFYFNELFSQSNILLILAIFALLIPLAGFYPAWVLSSFKPISVLKGRFSHSGSGALLRKGLVIGQFAISIAFIMGTLVIWKQMQFMVNQPLGFDKDKILIVDAEKVPWNIRSQNSGIFENTLLSQPGITDVTASAATPGRSGWIGQFAWAEGNPKQAQLIVEYIPVDENYIKTLGLKLLSGRDFMSGSKMDSSESLIINQAALKLFGWRDAESAIGKKLTTSGKEGNVIGVLKDYHQHGLQEKINPVVLGVDNQVNVFALKYNSITPGKAIKTAQTAWSKAYNGYSMEYSFMDDDFQRQYAKEEKFKSLFSIAAVISILIASMGLLGLAIYSSEKRIKEIGVRKVLGASVSGIVKMLTIDFLKLVIIGVIIALPIAWLIMNKWLEGFATRIVISWWLLLIAGLAAILIAVITVSFQAIKAAIANPIKSLRTE